LTGCRSETQSSPTGVSPAPEFSELRGQGEATQVADTWVTDCPKRSLEFREIHVGAVTLHVGCQGKSNADKPTIILLHGFPEYWTSWREVSSILAAKFRVVLPDQRGYDLSDKPLDPAAYRLDELVGDVAGLIEAISPTQPVILVGHDFGGLIAYAAASMLPEGKIAGLVIANAPHPNVYQQLFLADLAKLPSPVGQVAASQYVLTFLTSDSCPLSGFCPYAVPEAHYSSPDYTNLVGLVSQWGGASLVDQDLLNAWNRTPGPTASTHLTTMLNWYRSIVPLLFDRLPAFDVTVPTLVLWGTGDRILVDANIDVGVHPDYPGVQTLDVFIPNLEIRRFVGAGHFIQHRNSIEVAGEIKTFIDRLRVDWLKRRHP